MTARRKLQLILAQRRWFARRTQRLALAGLTTRGTIDPRRRWTELAGLHGKARAAKRQQLERAERVAQSKTIKGTVRIHRLKRRTPQALMFQALKEEIGREAA